jgi:hypothetical protein
MNHKTENVIREQRTIEATKKNFMGAAGKFGTILHAYGSPIFRQGSSLMDVRHLDDPYADFVDTEYSSTMSGQRGPLVSRDEILELDDDFVQQQGLLFDGLSRGIHLEIVYWHDTNEIKVHYRGFLVYREVGGELGAYAPFKEWEDATERLYRAAKEKMKKITKQEAEWDEELAEVKKRSYFQELRMRWGI